MFNVGEFVVYKRDVCEIMQIKEINNNLYYVLKPIEDKSLKLSIPIDNQFGYLRSIITKEEALELINNIINVEIIDNNDKLIENIRISNSNIINYLVVDLCENSSIETGLRFSDEALDTMYKIRSFNNENIYKHDKIKPTIRYFTVLINELFYALRNEFDGKNTIKNLKKMKRYYPTLAEEFTAWLSNYAITEDRDCKAYDNKLMYNLESLDDYNRAIVDYMSGMTDIYIVKIYNELINY